MGSPRVARAGGDAKQRERRRRSGGRQPAADYLATRQRDRQAVDPVIRARAHQTWSSEFFFR